MEEQNNTTEKRAKAIGSGLDKATEIRLEGYDVALKMRETKNNANRREMKRMQKKHGKSHPVVLQKEQAIAQHPYMAKAIHVQQQRTSNPISNPEKGTWQVSGILSDKAGNPLSDFTISLFTREGKWERALGYTCTDPNGIFKLQVTDPKILKTFEGMPFFVTVTNAKKEVLLTDPKPVIIKADGAEARILVLTDFNCAAPEAPTQTDGPPPVIELPKENEFVVWGFIKNARGIPMKDVTVRAVANTPDGDCDLGKPVKVDAEGRYKITYKASDFDGKIDAKEGPVVVISVFDAAGKRLLSKDSVSNVSTLSRIDAQIKTSWFGR